MLDETKDPRMINLPTGGNIAGASAGYIIASRHFLVAFLNAQNYLLTDRSLVTNVRDLRRGGISIGSTFRKNYEKAEMQ